MTRRKAWLCTFIGSALFWGGVVFLATAEQPTESRQIVPAFEFNCKGLKDVVLMEDGTLTANHKIYKLSHGYLNKMVFTNNVVIEGELEGDSLYFDKSVIEINGRRHSCQVE